MKTTKKLAIFIAFIALTFMSCSKDDNAIEPVIFQEENPIPNFLVNSGYNFSRGIASNPGGESELGFSFVPNVNGKIIALINKLHIPNTNLKVTIWDKSTATAIATNYVNVGQGTETKTSISSINLQKNKEYIISIKTKYYFVYQKENNANQTYPVNTGNISITGSLDGNANEMPSLAIGNSFTGDYSFVFQQTE